MLPTVSAINSIILLFRLIYSFIVRKVCSSDCLHFNFLLYFILFCYFILFLCALPFHREVTDILLNTNVPHKQRKEKK